MNVQTKGNFNRAAKPQGPLHNSQIKYQLRARIVRIVGSEPFIKNDEYSIDDALGFAEQQGVDLIAISTAQEIPICKLMPLDKYLYEQKQKEKEKKKQASAQELHELKFSPEISDNDVSYRVKQALDWLKKGDKVKCTLQFKGRQMMHRDRGELVLLQFADAVKEAGIPEHMPKLEGKRMFMILKPKK